MPNINPHLITHLNRTFAEHSVYLVARDATSKLQPNSTQRTTLIVAGVYIIAIAILWCVDRSETWLWSGR